MGTEKKRGNKEAKKAKSTTKGAKGVPKYMAESDLAAPNAFLPKTGKAK
ncbi:hypothetical protein [Amorphus coralli]|nr:hypothetical protein [Amorphus coralli]